MLVEMRKRKAAETELAITFSEEDSTVSMEGLCRFTPITCFFFILSVKIFQTFITSQHIYSHYANET